MYKERKRNKIKESYCLIECRSPFDHSCNAGYCVYTTPPFGVHCKSRSLSTATQGTPSTGSQAGPGELRTKCPPSLGIPHSTTAAPVTICFALKWERPQPWVRPHSPPSLTTPGHQGPLKCLNLSTQRSKMSLLLQTSNALRIAGIFRLLGIVSPHLCTRAGEGHFSGCLQLLLSRWPKNDSETPSVHFIRLALAEVGVQHYRQTGMWRISAVIHPCVIFRDGRIPHRPKRFPWVMWSIIGHLIFH